MTFNWKYRVTFFVAYASVVRLSRATNYKYISNTEANYMRFPLKMLCSVFFPLGTGIRFNFQDIFMKGRDRVFARPMQRDSSSTESFLLEGERSVIKKRKEKKNGSILTFFPAFASRGQCSSAALTSRSLLMKSSAVLGLSCSIKTTSEEILSVMPIKPESIKRY